MHRPKPLLTPSLSARQDPALHAALGPAATSAALAAAALAAAQPAARTTHPATASGRHRTGERGTL